eukprot:Hpha_TRINITY_DN16467_c4_g4::TRINITY_DN16467_c4_g4_i1::g.160854::m.160854
MSGHDVEPMCRCAELQRADAFEVFPKAPETLDMPIIVYHDEPGSSASSYLCSLYTVYKGGRVGKRVETHGEGHKCSVWTRYPVAMSPAYLRPEGFAVEPYENRYLHYDGVGMVFQRESGAYFMPPSIDTVLTCAGLKSLFAGDVKFTRAVDVGCGSSFIGKYAALKCPGPIDSELQVDLVDIDPYAEKYAKSWGFAAPQQQRGGRPVVVKPRTMDAIEFLSGDMGRDCDLIISNPPYIPTEEEARGKPPPGPEDKERFWKGVGMLCSMVRAFANGHHPRPGAHLVLVVSSLSLKAPAVKDVLEYATKRGCIVTPLLVREVVYKAWYAGHGGCKPHLLASKEEMRGPVDIAGCKLWVGCSPPHQPRACAYKDGREHYDLYHHHFVHVLGFKFR